MPGAQSLSPFSSRTPEQADSLRSPLRLAAASSATPWAQDSSGISATSHVRRRTRKGESGSYKPNANVRLFHATATTSPGAASAPSRKQRSKSQGCCCVSTTLRTSFASQIFGRSRVDNATDGADNSDAVAVISSKRLAERARPTAVTAAAARRRAHRCSLSARIALLDRRVDNAMDAELGWA